MHANVASTYFNPRFYGRSDAPQLQQIPDRGRAQQPAQASHHQQALRSLQQIGKYPANENKKEHKHGQMKSLSRKTWSTHGQNKQQQRDQKRRGVAEIADALPSARSE